MEAENHKRRLVNCDEEDRISNLPEQLIDAILERIPIQDAVRTSILSKKWRYRWTTLQVVVLDEQFSKKFGKNGAFGRNGLVRIINQIFFLHKGPILKFYLHIPNIYLDSYQEIDQWMLFLSRNGVKDLTFKNSKQECYELPSYVFSCRELTKLKLTNCIFKPLVDLGGFMKLECLFLMNIVFGANSNATVVSLPHLKKLSLDTCTFVYNFKIKAPALEKFFVLGCPDAMLLQFTDSPFLKLVSICYRKPLEDVVPVEMMNLVKLLDNLPKVENLCMDGYFLKFLGKEEIPNRLPNASYSLKYLKLSRLQHGDFDHLRSALCLLRSSPELRVLYLYLNPVQMQPLIMNYDAGPASMYLEDLDFLDQTLERLLIVEITIIEGSKPELLFIKLLLAISPSLEKLTIKLAGVPDADKGLRIATDVMRFPRASTKAEIIYLYPKS